MAFAILGTPKPQFFDSSGAPLTSGTLTVWEPSTDLPKATYPTYDDAEALTNANDNPITLDGRGECELWGIDGEDYKLTLKDSFGNTVWTTDDVFLPTAVTRASVGALLYPVTTAETSAGVTPTNYYYKPGNVLRYGATGDGSTDDATAIQNAIDGSSGFVYFPQGTYLIGTQITLKANTHYYGDEDQATILKQKDSSNIAKGLLVSQGWADDNTTADGPIIFEHFRVDGNKANNATATDTDGLRLMSFFCKIRYCDFRSCTGHGLHFDDKNSATTNITGTAVENRVYFCRLDSNDLCGLKAEGNIGLTDGMVQNCIVGSNGQEGIYIARGAGWHVADNHVYNNGFHAIRLNLCQNCAVSDNDIQDWGTSATTGEYYAIVMGTAQNEKPSLVTNNSIHQDAVVGGSTYYGIGVTHGSGVTLAQTQFRGNFMYGVGSETAAFRTVGTGYGRVDIISNTVQNFGSTYIAQDGPAGINVTHTGNSFDTHVQTFSNNNATPPVRTGSFFKTGNTGSTTITDFDDGFDGQVIKVIINDTFTTVDFTASGLKGNGGQDWSPTTGDHMTCTYDGTDWYCDVSSTTAGSAYSETNVSTDRAFDADTVLIAELADVVGTLIADLRSKGIVS